VPGRVRKTEKPRGANPSASSFQYGPLLNPRTEGTNRPDNVCIYRSPSSALMLEEADLFRCSCFPALQLYFELIEVCVECANR
jgi:hypothetical protein